MLMIQTPYACGKDITSVTKSLENAAEIVFTWLDKYHVVLSTHKDMNVGIGTSHIKKQLLGKVTGCKNRL